MSLRRASMVFAAALAAIGAGVAVTLIVLTTNLHRAAHEIATGVESLRIGEELEFGLVSLRVARQPLTRTAAEDLIRRQLADAPGYVGSDDEQTLLETLKNRVDLYIAAVDRAAADPSDPSLEERARIAFENAFDGTRAWVRINVEQSRSLKETAAHWDEIANVIGTTAIVLVILGLGGLGLWLQRRAFRPALTLVGAIDRYAHGERTARASEQGPEEFRTIAHRFNDMASALERQREGQLAFLAGVAHDIRNPLAALKMTTAAVPPDQPLPPEPRMRQLFARVDRQISRLERMVYDFLDASRIESGNLELQLVQCDVTELVRATLDLFEPAARTHQLVVRAPQDPVLVRCDPMRIEQVLANLVSNAIKYSPRGGPVHVTVEQNAESVLVSVTDEGRGMSPADIEKLFEPFQRVGVSTGSIPGVGLGLFVARRIIEAHGGTIAVSSSEGHGSTFTIHIPLGASPNTGARVT